MKKIFMICVFAVASVSVFAQVVEQKALVDSKSYDNWYVGVNGGVSTKTTHNKWMDNINANAGLRVGRWYTPCFGLMVEDNVYFNDRPHLTNAGTFAKANQLNVGATINFMNWFGGYKGEPRLFEIIGVPAVGWAHAFGNHSKRATNLNALMGKVAVDLAFNLGKKKAWQVYVEPAFNYSIYGTKAEHMMMNINNSAFQLNAGFVYKFKNTNGTHNFAYAEPVVITDQSTINALREEISRLKAENAALRNQPKQEIVNVVNNFLQPVVVFRQNSSVIDEVQYAEIERVAQFMKQNQDTEVSVMGYASTEGPADLNQRLSEERAVAVADALVEKYGIERDRLSVSSYGATDEQSSEQSFNRVVTFAVKSK